MTETETETERDCDTFARHAVGQGARRNTGQPDRRGLDDPQPFYMT
jgi:hypothetical protein